MSIIILDIRNNPPSVRCSSDLRRGKEGVKIMAKAKKSARSTKRKVAKRKSFIEYNSFTFLLFLVFVLLVSLLLVAKMLATN